jgi:predicted ArsR family transcriptional regulator
VTAADVERRWDLLMAWLEETFALEAGWETTGDGGRRIVVHHCPFQDIAADRPKVCGTFVTTLIGELLGGVDVNHEAADDPVRCCTLEVKEWDARRAGS